MKTILYYTSNREDPKFERKIMDNIRKNSDLPTVSVSQKPISFGGNICVGDVGHSYLNEWRQILIGAKACKTKYLVFTESDFLYPKEYFDFEPAYECVYRAANVWICYHNREHYYKKKFSEGAQIVRRDYIIDALEYNLKGMPKWVDGPVPWPNNRQRKNMHSMPFKVFGRRFPCVSFKTGKGMRGTTSIGERTRKLPIWGRIDRLKEKYLKESVSEK